MNQSDIIIREMESNEWDRVAELIHDSTNAWYTNRGLSAIFTHGPKSVRLFCEVYESLDPGCCLIAEDCATGRLAGSCFFHPRSTHCSLGIMNVHPDCFGMGVARKLLTDITDRADQAKLPTRLVSSAMNLDSYSLYNRAGFVPRQAYQDMLIAVPNEGMSTLADAPTCDRFDVHDAVAEDLESAAQLERQLVGIARRKDLDFFHDNTLGVWHLSIAKDHQGNVCGFMASVRHQASNMVGPGVATTAEVARALIYNELQSHAGNTCVVLVPVDESLLSSAMYGWGARNCEMHFAQVRGEWQAPTGIVIPSFMPESG